MGQNAAAGLLCLDPDPLLLRYLRALFEDLAVHTAADSGQALETLKCQPQIGVLVADSRLASPELIGSFCEFRPDGLIVLLGQQPPDPGLDIARSGAVFRTLQRPVREGDLVQTVRQAVAVYRLRREMSGKTGSGDDSLERRAEHLAELNRLKDELVMIAAHDIRAPLSVILGYCDILLGNEPGVSAGGREILERIHASADRLLTMVNNVLNLAALEEGRLDLKLTPTRLSQVVHDVTESLAGLIEERHVECRVEISGDERTYDLDRIKLTQVLQNLVTNAIKFNRPNGIVHIKAAGAPGEISFAVCDTGLGMTPEQAERAFQKFVRFASGATTGSGLGLAIAKGLVELHGGRIRLETRPGEGSTFHFTVKPGVQGGPVRSLLR